VLTDLGRTGYTHATGPLADPRERWIHSLPSRYPTQPVPVRELLLAVSQAGALQAIDRTTGSLAWENRTPCLLTTVEEPLDIPAALAVDGNRAYVNVEDTFRAVDCATGQTLWHKTWPLADASGPPTAGNGALLVTGRRHLSRIDPENGSTQWVCNLPEPGPVATAATIAGNLAWIAEAASPYHPGGLHVIDLISGKLRARTSAGIYLYPFHPTVAGSLAWTLMFDEDQQTVALAAFDDACHITQTLRPSCVDFGQELIAPAVAHQTVLVTDAHHIHALDLTSGRTHWSAPTTGAPAGPPLVTKDAIYQATTDGTVQCHHLTTGDTLWTHRTGTPISSQTMENLEDGYVDSETPTPLTVIEGTLYIRTNEAIHALSAKTGVEGADREPEPAAERV
jgi:outer membrane protein assembly factor BamB